MSKNKKADADKEENKNKFTDAEEKALNSLDKGIWEDLLIQKKVEIASKVQEIYDLIEQLRVDKIDNDREKQLQERIEYLLREEREKELAHHDELQKQEKDQSQKLIQMDNISQAKIDDNRKSAQKAAEKDARDREFKKIQENKLLKQQLIIKQKEVLEMKKERDNLLKFNKNSKLNLQVNKEGILEYQIVNQKQENQIKKIKDEVEKLKQQISDDVTKQTKELEFMRLQDKQRREELQYKIDQIKAELKIKNIDLKNVKNLANYIIDQRSQIESFFLDSLNNIKQQIRDKYKLKKNTNVSINSSLKLPEITNKSQPTDQQNFKINFENKINFSDLELEEKEKILRVLFKKLNFGSQPIQWDQDIIQQQISINNQIN
ncbi:hypothetical protein IMG5_194710 [Ichthyophthirius multifiliis]|uniref:Uncharacterized protein n=1 Tax=Ichthyophthirius multifiliis TaxID=5932 RepID=G0R4T4_ICHMU|nr:hypothetical protein IMG5_194710 [Ichthyophthirius multifiliis]EGR27522.1 hypothetical protein IMG5_194710 [Ichthyophthirius multifiliis]|eukprot:XP_004024974.1 hypothetical protein IMG5_194710 [Ichthyophthirius multifiliis]